jgi:hypothetical protein
VEPMHRYHLYVHTRASHTMTHTQSRTKAVASQHSQQIVSSIIVVMLIGTIIGTHSALACEKRPACRRRARSRRRAAAAHAHDRTRRRRASDRKLDAAACARGGGRRRRLTRIPHAEHACRLCERSRHPQTHHQQHCRTFSVGVIALLSLVSLRRSPITPNVRTTHNRT